MPKLDGKHYSYDAAGRAAHARDKQKKKKQAGRKKKRSTLRSSMLGGETGRAGQGGGY